MERIQRFMIPFFITSVSSNLLLLLFLLLLQSSQFFSAVQFQEIYLNYNEANNTIPKITIPIE